MKKKNIVFIIILTVSLIIIGGCMGKSDRTFGPISLNITSDKVNYSNPYIQGNTYTLTVNLGFPNYTWAITSTDNYGSTIDPIGSDKAILHVGYSDTINTYILTIKATDSKGNSKSVDYFVSKVPVVLDNGSGSTKYKAYCNDSTDDVYLSVSPSLMPDFSKWVIESGPGVIDNVNTNPAIFHSDGSGTTGLTKVYAQDSAGHKSSLGTIIVYNYQSYIYSAAAKDGYVSKNVTTGIRTVNSDDVTTKVGYDTLPASIKRSFFSFPIPASVGNIYYAVIYVRKVSHTPSDLYYYNSVYLKYIGMDTIPAAGLTDAVYALLNDTVSDANNFYYFPDYRWSQLSYTYFYISGIPKDYDYKPFLIDRLNSCQGHNFDIGLRFQDENPSEYQMVTYYTADNTSSKPYMYIEYY